MGLNGFRGVLGALLVAVMVVPAAGASPQEDNEAIVKDFARDRKITPCLFAQGQLENARMLLTADADAYTPGLRDALNREIKRWKDGDCRGKLPAGVDVRIVRIHARGGPKKESVTLKNFGRATVSLRRFVLRDADDHAIRFKKTTIKPGRSIVVVTGCRRGHSGALRKGSRYYACRKTQFWDDAGDVVELVNPKGALVSRKRYGTLPASPPAA
jgi:hypothetical protein